MENETLPETLDMLTYEHCYGMKCSIASNPNTSSEILYKLSCYWNCFGNTQHSFERNIAQKPKTLLKALKNLIKINDKQTKEYIFSHPNCPEILKLLYK